MREIAPRFREESETVHQTCPGAGNVAVPNKTRFELILTLLLPAKDGTMVTTGEEAGRTVTVFDAVAERTPSDKIKVNTEVVDAVFASAVSTSTANAKADAEYVKLQRELYTGAD